MTTTAQHEPQQAVVPRVACLLFDERGRPFHWCPACGRLHPLPSDTSKWTFDGNLERPSFTPSFRQYLTRSRQCHYILTAGVLNFCADSTHSLAGQSVPLPPIPEGVEP